MGSKFTKNDCYWKQPSVENSYWAGLIAADGYVESHPKRGYSLQLKLKESDEVLLQGLKQALQYTGPIYPFKTKTGEQQKRLMIFGSKLLLNDLEHVFNITTKKTFTLQPPKLTNVEHVKAFITGYIDGDGCIGNYFYKKPAVNRLTVQILGTKEFLTWIKEQANVGGNINKYGSIFALTYSCKSARLFAKWILTIEVPKLKRKWRIIDDSII